MVSVTQFQPVRLKRTVEHISKAHLTIREKAYISSEDKLDEILSKVEAIKEDEMDCFAYTLGNGALELMLSAYLNPGEDSMRSKLGQVLRHRAGKRLFNLNWAMLQEDYRNPVLIESMKIFMERVRLNFKEYYDRSLFKRLEDSDKDLFQRILDLAEEEKGLLGYVFEKLNINTGSSLGKDLCTSFFKSCGRDGFINNRELFCRFLDECGEELATAIAQRYLEELEVYDYIYPVNLLLLDKFSSPGSTGLLWENVNDQAKFKFKEWMRLQDLEEHFKKDYRRASVWKEHYLDIKNIICEKEAGILFIDFGSFTVVDWGLEHSCCRLYRKRVFDLKYRQYLAEKAFGKASWPEDMEEAVTAKKAFLEDRQADIYIMNYDGVAALYIKEIVSKELKRGKPSKRPVGDLQQAEVPAKQIRSE